MKILLLFLPIFVAAQTQKVSFNYALIYNTLSGNDIKEYTIYANSKDYNYLLLNSENETYLVKDGMIYYGDLTGEQFDITDEKEIDIPSTFKYYQFDSLYRTNKTITINDFQSLQYIGKLITSGDNQASYDVIFDMYTGEGLESNEYLKRTPLFSYVDFKTNIPQGIPSMITLSIDGQKFDLVELKKISKINKTITFIPINDFENDFDNTNVYISSYKELNLDSIANTLKEIRKNDKKRYLLKTIPSYCSKPFGVPAFSKESMNKTLNNYLMQLCDLYLYSSNSVIADSLKIEIKQKIDALRKGMNEILSIKMSLDKSEQKLLENYLNILD